jgi:hypothetical protein
MQLLTMDDFLSWLASHRDYEIVGLAGQCFDSPLSRWLSQRLGYLVGVEGKQYGRVQVDTCRWLHLPTWAQVFSQCCERHFARPLSAYDAVGLLVQVETALSCCSGKAR